MGGRVSVVEYEPYADFVAHAAAACAATPDEVRRAVRVQGDRLRRVLNLGASPIWLNGNELVAEDIAGLVRLLPGLEVEIAPKFLGTGWEHWREDFLVVANIARSGQLLIREGIASSTGVRDDLASLIARTFTDLFERNRRLPLRTYRRQRVEEWSLDGDVDPEEVVLPGTDGYRIERTVLTNQNRHNAVIAHAARVLAPEVHDGVLQRQVHRIAQRLSPQRPPPNRPRVSVPTRHRRWQQCYDLAREINAGFGVRLAPDRYSSPGYVLSTPSAFEHLLVTALRVALPGAQVTYHPSFRLGARQDGSEVSVTPDVIVRQAGGGLSLLDAKYKGRAERAPRIAAADLYEALAFAEAAQLDRVTLVYPRPIGGADRHPIGTTTFFEQVTVAERVVLGATVECRGLSARAGFVSFAHGIAALVTTH